MKKNLAMSKTFCNFAVLYISRSRFVGLLIAGFFCACSATYGVTPAKNCNGTSGSLSVKQRVGNAVFLVTSKQKTAMLYAEKVCKQGANSTLVATRPTERNPKTFSINVSHQTYLLVCSVIAMNDLYDKVEEATCLYYGESEGERFTYETYFPKHIKAKNVITNVMQDAFYEDLFDKKLNPNINLKKR